MTITFELTAREKVYHIPGSRRWKYQPKTITVKADVRECANEEAPVALHVPQNMANIYGGTKYAGDFRYFEGNFYVLRKNDTKNLGEEVFKLGAGIIPKSSPEEAERIFHNNANRLLIVDDKIWMQSKYEPIYVLSKYFGIGITWSCLTKQYPGAYFFNMLQKDEMQATAMLCGYHHVFFHENGSRRTKWGEVFLPETIKFQQEETVYRLTKTITQEVYVRASTMAEAVNVAEKIPSESLAIIHTSISGCERPSEEEYVSKTVVNATDYQDAAEEA